MNTNCLKCTSLVSVIIFGLSLTSCKDKKNEGKSSGSIPVVVTVAPSVQKTGFLYVEAIGSCVAKESVKIVSQVSGQLMKICFSQGAEVKKGDLLFKIDDRSYQAILEQKKANLAMDEAKLSLNEAQLNRSATLLQGQFVSQQDYDSYKANVDISKANILCDKGAIAQAALDVEHCTVESPIDGKISKFYVDVGNVIAADTVLTTVQTISQIYVDYAITESDFTLLKQFMNGALKVEVTSMVNPEKKATADLFFVDNQIASTTGTILIRSEMKNENHAFWPGESINGKVYLKELKDAVMIPTPSVQLNQQGKFVFVVKGNGEQQTVEMRSVVLGQLQENNMVLIKDGVKPGEKVVTSGFVMLYPGAKVVVVDPSQMKNNPVPEKKTGDKK